MRRRPVLERLEQEAELRLGLVLGQPDHLEDPLLHLRLVDPDRAAAELDAVHHDVVRLGQRPARLVAEPVAPLGYRRGERMVHGAPAGGAAVLGLLRFEHRPLDDPDEAPRRLVHQPAPPADLQPGRTQQLARRARLAGGEEDRVAAGRTARLGQPGQVLGGQVLRHRAARLAGLGVQHRVRQPAGAARARPLLPGVELPAGLRRSARHDDRPDVRCLEDPEPGAGEVRRQVHQLEPEPQVGLVRAVARHSLGVRHPRDRPGQLVAGQLRPQPRQHVLGHRDHVVGVHEGHLEVELGELELPVRALVLVPEAAGQLVVAFQPGDHQQLLEQLRRLRQGVPAAGLQPHRDQEVPGALRGGPGQVRRLYLDEVPAGQGLPGDPVGLRAQPQRGGRSGPA